MVLLPPELDAMRKEWGAGGLSYASQGRLLDEVARLTDLLDLTDQRFWAIRQQLDSAGIHAADPEVGRWTGLVQDVRLLVAAFNRLASEESEI